MKSYDEVTANLFKLFVKKKRGLNEGNLKVRFYLH